MTALYPMLLFTMFSALCGPTPPLEAPVTWVPALQVANGHADTLRAKYLIAAADDFIVDVYLNGKAVPDSKRSLLNEVHGATVERIDIEVHKGDWLVFNVVNDRLRWGGAYYFAFAGCLAKDEFGFVSSLDNSNWSACDLPSEVDRFITQRTYMQQRPAQRISQVWGDGDGLMRYFAGDTWRGTPLWGNSKNTWIKVQVE